MKLRTRLTFGYLLLLALCLAVFGVGVYEELSAHLYRAVTATLRTQTEELVVVAAQAPNRSSLVADIGRPLVDQGAAVTLRLQAPGQPVLALSSTLRGTPLPPVAVGSPVVLNHVLLDGRAQTVEAYSLTFEHYPSADIVAHRATTQPPDLSGTLTVARSLTGVKAATTALRNIEIASGAATLAIAAILGLVLTAHLLRPLERMRAVAQEIGDEHDLTRRVPVGRRSDELARLSRALNHMLAALEHAHAGVAEALAAQRRFVADASHELRTPLTTVRTNIEFLTRSPDAPHADRQAALADTLLTLRRVERLVTDLLSLTRLQSASPRRRLVRLDVLLRSLFAEARRFAGARTQVRLELLPTAWVHADADDLRRALWNVLDNALKYSPHGDVTIGLTVEGEEAAITISDSGIGISPQDLPLIFDRFWRAPTVRGSAGSGLGLAISQQIAIAHGGKLTAQSQPGVGTTFVFTLPTAPSDVIRQREVPAPDAADGAAVASGEGSRRTLPA